MARDAGERKEPLEQLLFVMPVTAARRPRCQAFLNGAAEVSIMRQTRHKSLNTLRKYIRDRSLFRDNPAVKLGL